LKNDNTMKKLFFATLLLFAYSVYGQISTNEKPISFNTDIPALTKNDKTYKSLPPLNMITIEKEDEEDEANGIPPRFGYPHEVNYNLHNSGEWIKLSDGGRIWRLSIFCPDALSINLLYDKFWIPDGAKIFIYSNDHKHSIGAFTSVNNIGDRDNLQGFATGLVYSNQVTLEYYVPKEVKDIGVISIVYVVHGYRHIILSGSVPCLGYGCSGDCQVNINCSEGQNWQNEKNAVALILVNGIRHCTGSLINTTANDNRPLFLTAHHCLAGGDAINNPNLPHFSFYWHYESPTCSNIGEPAKISTVGATVVANSCTTDFALLRLDVDPVSVPNITPYYLGWDRSGNTGTGGVGIHHPRGDVKKISTYTITPSNSSCLKEFQIECKLFNSNYWMVNWSQTANGFSGNERGSSGSALLNNERRIIGQLYGNGTCWDLDCNCPELSTGIYGKFHISWTGNGTTNDKFKLQPWLDPLGTGALTLDGMKALACPPSMSSLPIMNGSNITINTTWSTPVKAINTITIQSGATLTIKSIVKCDSTTSFIVHPGGKLIIDGGKLTSFCTDDMWKGIVVYGNPLLQQLPQHQGMVELKNEAVIEHALCAINVATFGDYDPPPTGGIVKADSAIFRNNLKAIEYLPYENHDPTGKIIDNVGKFTNCTFVIDNDNRFTNNGTTSWNHVTLWGVRDVTFEGCVFQDKTGLFSAKLPVPTTRGIYTIDASVKVINHCRKGGYTGVDCPCHESYTEPSKFINLTNGIQSYNTGSSHRLFLDQSHFNYCSSGVNIYTQNDDRITRCSFENNNTGLHTSNSSGYTIQENTFTSRYPSTGISINNSGSAENRVYNNDFNNIEKGIFVQGTNYSSSNIQGLQFLNNTFTGGDYDIYLSQNTTVRPNQGSFREGVNNKFTGTTTSSFFSQGSNQQPITYYHSSGINSVYSPKNPTSNITVVPNVMAGSSVSTLCSTSVKTEIITDSILHYKMLQQQYDKLFAQLKDNPELLPEILTLSDAMRELSNHAISRILDNNVLSLDELKQWYEVIRTPIAKYSLAEVYVYEGKYDQAEAVLRQIPDLFAFNETEMIEHNNYMQFYHFKKQMKLSERNWTQLDETEIAQLQTIAEATHGRSASMAKGVLCFFFDICYEDEIEESGEEVIPQKNFSAENETTSDIPNQKATYELILYPNPTESEVTVTIHNPAVKIVEMELFDVYGKKIYQQTVNQSYGIIKLNDLDKGVFILKVYLNQGNVVIRKVVKQ